MNPGRPEVTARRALLAARAAIDDALRTLDTDERPPSEGVADPLEGASPVPMALEDLDLGALRRAVDALPTPFDTYHVVEHPEFRAAHPALLDRPAINQLAGKMLRRNAALLGITYGGQRGRRRSALWRRQEH